jgi:hypothetical protein
MRLYTFHAILCMAYGGTPMQVKRPKLSQSASATPSYFANLSNMPVSGGKAECELLTLTCNLD